MAEALPTTHPVVKAVLHGLARSHDGRSLSHNDAMEVVSAMLALGATEDFVKASEYVLAIALACKSDDVFWPAAPVLYEIVKSARPVLRLIGDQRARQADTHATGK